MEYTFWAIASALSICINRAASGDHILKLQSVQDGKIRKILAEIRVMTPLADRFSPAFWLLSSARNFARENWLAGAIRGHLRNKYP